MPPSPSHRRCFRLLALIVLAGTALRLWLGWWLGHLVDLDDFRAWALNPGEAADAAQTLGVNPCNYPPLYVSILRLMRWAHEGLHLPGDFTASLKLAQDVSLVRPIILYLKLPAIAADALCAVLLFRLGVRLGRPEAGLGCAALYTFNPAILYDGAYYGQTDTILFALSLAVVTCLIRKRPFLLGFCAVAAILFKAQAVATLVVVAAAVVGEWRTFGRPAWVRLLAGGGSALAMAVALAAATGRLSSFVSGYVGITEAHPRVTNNALNLWWLICRPWDRTPYMHTFPLDSTPWLPGVTPRLIGILLFFLGIGLIVWRLHKARYSPYALILAAAAAGWVFFLLLTQMHERYSVPAVGFMCTACLWNRRWYLWATVASVAAALNIVLAAYFVFPPARWLVTAVNWIIWPEREREWTILAAVLLLMLPVCLEALWRLGRPASAPPAGFPVLSDDWGERTVHEPQKP